MLLPLVACIYPNNLKILFLREIKVLEVRQSLEALVILKRQALTQLQGLLAPSLHVAKMAFLQPLKTSFFMWFGYAPNVKPVIPKRSVTACREFFVAGSWYCYMRAVRYGAGIRV